MKTVILAGGLGTRLSEYTDIVPKPMVTVGEKPIIWHIMNHYASFGHTDFILALGYKAEVIRDYFQSFRSLNSDFTINLESGQIEWLGSSSPNWNVTLIDTGIESLTGTRLRKLESLIGDERFMLTYGDGLSNVNIDDLVSFHENHGKQVTMTAVRPTARFGELSLSASGEVESFEEKPQIHSGWINGGFFVFEPSFFSQIPAENVMLEREPLAGSVQKNELMAFEHSGFWQCMDTKRDLDNLRSLWESGEPPWLNTAKNES